MQLLNAQGQTNIVTANSPDLVIPALQNGKILSNNGSQLQWVDNGGSSSSIQFDYSNYRSYNTTFSSNSVKTMNISNDCLLTIGSISISSISMDHCTGQNLTISNRSYIVQNNYYIIISPGTSYFLTKNSSVKLYITTVSDSGSFSTNLTINYSILPVLNN